MKLHYSPTSPYVRKVMVLLQETGQMDDVELVPASGTPIDSSAMPLSSNPLGKIPTLERPDGASLYDSRVICRYLDDRAGGILYPQGNRLWESLTLEATADGILDAAILMVYELRLRPEGKRFDDWLEGQWAKIQRSVTTINTRWMSQLSGPLDIGQISVACALGYVDFRHGDRNWRKDNDALDDWYAAFSERDSMASTTPPA